MTYASFVASPFAPMPVMEPVLTEVTPNSGLVVTVEEAKAHLSYPTEDTSIDAEISAFIRAAQRAIEHYCSIDLLPTVWREDRPYLDASVVLRKRPYASFASIEYVAASDGEITTLAATEYHVLATSLMRAAVYVGKGSVWPSAADRGDAYRMTYTTGWADADSVPQDIKIAVLMTAAKLDSARGDCGDGDENKFAAQVRQASQIVPAGARALLDPYRLVELYAI